jgi:hypothetical protein
MNARTLILTAGAALALSVPAANAGTHKNASPLSKPKTHQTIKNHTGSSKSKTKVTATKSDTPVSTPAAPGSGVPIPATTTHDYDNPLITGTQSVTPSTTGSTTGVIQSPTLTDGYLR